MLWLDSTAAGVQSEEEAGLKENGNRYQSEGTPHSDGELGKINKCDAAGRLGR